MKICSSFLRLQTLTTEEGSQLFLIKSLYTQLPLLFFVTSLVFQEKGGKREREKIWDEKCFAPSVMAGNGKVRPP